MRVRMSMFVMECELVYRSKERASEKHTHTQTQINICAPLQLSRIQRVLEFL